MSREMGSPLWLLLCLWAWPLGGAGAGEGVEAGAMPGDFGYVQRGWQWLLEEAEGCGQCQPELCPPLLGCLAGAVLPPCGCCWECANLEGQMCDLDDTSHFYGRCGAGLECRLDLGDLLHGHVPEPQCVCSSPEAVCGSDNNTYPHVCSFQEAVNTNSSTNLTLAHSGPCQAVPQIVSPPYDVWNVTGEDVIFGCEVFAYPMASIEWWKDGAETFLPGDDPHISIQARGGPRRYAVSGWLQIQGIRSSDGGQYQCRARNQLGEASATARLTVQPYDQLQSLSTPPVDDYSDPEDYY
ncbi:kazal-type serine protease inhibitor domain-containing protein 1 [Callorhinchus milii]|uniref:kazal-type serine protease inhibitor domain-containing protein 1 n=1 Tax=Callorhinchus milii TaxID=7868 RepID=UPI000457461D|nr:kazal-type serine protease inhibitor domain-containing protein 1 [Callorhinchus milii]XP_042192976.1 kazal-type serine protease inhibitor domain-containing protein 1 [Callorhinchus milii]|eukprot:gi/632987538/ref/XP_007882613.1/ PREDICTED: kazal-type serine protease inhibitor domain-containing protein 1 [Callorhinchus milii]